MVFKLSSALTEPKGVKREKAMKEKNNLRPRLEKMEGRRARWAQRARDGSSVTCLVLPKILKMPLSCLWPMTTALRCVRIIFNLEVTMGESISKQRRSSGELHQAARLEVEWRQDGGG